MKTFTRYSKTVDNATKVQMIIPEKSHSIKYILFGITEQSRSAFKPVDWTSNIASTNIYTDGVSTQAVSATGTSAGSSGDLESYQIRIGGRWYPGQPISTLFGGAEAYLELLKVLDANGDYTFNGRINSQTWVQANAGGGRGGCSIFGIQLEQGNLLGSDVLSGLNGEEVSDLQLELKFSTTGGTASPGAFQIVAITCSDQMMIVRDRNIIDLVK
jgi:hypothetical protein